MSQIKIGVTGTGSLIGQAIIKSIRKSDLSDKISVIGFDYFINTVGSFWCDQHYVLPDILKAENKDHWRSMLFELIRKDNLSILFIGVDFELSLFAQMRQCIEKETGCKVVVSSDEVIETGNDKYLTYEFLKSHRLNYPKTWLPSEVANASLQYPCILKPRVGARSKGVYVIQNREDLFQKIQLSREPLVQELIGDEDCEYTCGVLCFDDKLMNSIVLKRYLKEGNTFIAEYKEDYDPKIYEYIKQIAAQLKPYGSCNLQLRTNSKGEPFLFEINPRFSGTTYMRSLFGYKEVEYTIKHLLGIKNEVFQLRPGKAYRYFEEKLGETGR